MTDKKCHVCGAASRYKSNGLDVCGPTCDYVTGTPVDYYIPFLLLIALVGIVIGICLLAL